MLSLKTLSILALNILLIFSECCRAEYERCDSYEWYKNGNHCYSFETAGKKYSFYDAEDYCRSKGSHLASVHSREESRFLMQLLEIHGGRRWLGLNILDGKHLWTDDTIPNYIDLYNKTQYKIEKCFMLYVNGSFRPEHCELRYSPICKKNVGDPSTPIAPYKPTVVEGNCPDDWLQFGQKCFKFFGENQSDRKKYKDAKRSCIGLGKDHDLATIHTMEEQAFLTEKLGSFGSSAWIGMSHVESDEIGQILVFGWTDNSRTNFTYWAPLHPPPGTWKYCARLSYDGVNKGEWVADYCDINPYGYICQKPPTFGLPPQQPEVSPVCGYKAVQYGEHCYEYYSTPKSRDEAEETCKSSGSHLVSVTDSFESAFLYNLLHGKSRYIWNGLKTVQNTRIFRWSDNEPFYFSKWSKIPQPTTQTPTCTFMNTTDELAWNMTQCTNKFPFVCKSRSSELPKAKDVIGQCIANEFSWVDIGDEYCYHIGSGKDDRLRWGDLARYCVSKGMEAISVHSEHQAKSLMAYLWQYPYSFWLGMIRTYDRQSFMWLDQTPVNFTLWDDREPSSSQQSDCVSVSTRNGKWKSENCDSWIGAICRAKKIFTFV